MYPTLLDGDKVTVILQKEYCINDILVLKTKEQLMIHRLIQIKLIGEKKYYLTKGDNNSFIDRWYPEHVIVGKVISINNSVI